MERYKKAIRRLSNLPLPPTSLVDRERELEDARTLLLRNDVHLLTLTGAGGTGKTRLGLELALGLLDEFPDGAYFVSLAEVRDANLVLPSVGGALGFLESGSRPLIEGLGEYLLERRLLLFLDNLEQVLEAAPVIARLLEACPKLKILATSRAPLRIRAEHEFPVLPLVVPDVSHIRSIGTLLEYSSVALFVKRAQAVRPDFVLDNQNTFAVASICTKLDGLPLALELAAVRIRMFSPEELMRGLADRLGLLIGGQRDLPARQRTLRDTIAWSYDLLDPEDQKLFRELSIFAGGFSLEAAATTCEAAQKELLERLSRLVEKNLLRTESTGGVLRFKMLETLRDYGSTTLTPNESRKVLQNHARFFLSLAELGGELNGPVQSSWLDAIELEHDNLLAALRWAIENREVEVGLRLAWPMYRFWSVRGRLTEGREWLAKTLAMKPSRPIAMRGKALMAAGVLGCMQDDFEAGRQLLEESLALAEEVGDKDVTAFALNSLGITVRNQGDFAGGRILLDRSLALFQELGHKWGTALVLNSLGVTARAEGEYSKARELHEQSLPLFRELGDAKSVGRALMNLGMIMERSSQYDEARELLDESLTLFQEQGENVGMTEALYQLGQLARRRGKYPEACDLLAQCLILSRELGHKEMLASSLEEFAACACKQGDAVRAARLLGTAEALREAIRMPIPPAYRPDHRQCVEAATAILGLSRFSKEQSEGKATPLDDAIREALTLQARPV